MNFSANSQYLNEAVACENKWKDFGILRKIPSKRVRQSTAVLLENQQLINEMSTDTGDIANFKRIS